MAKKIRETIQDAEHVYKKEFKESFVTAITQMFDVAGNSSNLPKEEILKNIKEIAINITSKYQQDDTSEVKLKENFAKNPFKSVFAIAIIIGDIII